MGTVCSSWLPDNRLLATREKVSSDKKERKFDIEKETIIEEYCEFITL